jgi:hypothetical protein
MNVRSPLSANRPAADVPELVAVAEVVPGFQQESVCQRADQAERDGPGGHVEDDPGPALGVPVPAAGHRDRDRDPGDNAQCVGPEGERSETPGRVAGAQDRRERHVPDTTASA